MLAEVTNVFTLLLPLLGVALIGYFIGELLGAQPIYERFLELSRRKAEKTLPGHRLLRSVRHCH